MNGATNISQELPEGIFGEAAVAMICRRAAKKLALGTAVVIALGTAAYVWQQSRAEISTGGDAGVLCDKLGATELKALLPKMQAGFQVELKKCDKLQS